MPLAKALFCLCPSSGAAQEFKTRAIALLHGEYAKLIDMADRGWRMRGLRSRTSTASTHRDGVHRGALAAVAGGRPAKALQRLSEVRFCQDSDALRTLHPIAPPPFLPAATMHCAPFIPDETSVWVALRAALMSAPGPTGLRAEHIVFAFSPGSATTLLSLVAAVASGTGPDCLRHSRLLAVAKPAGGIRPIAIGDIIRRVAASVLLRAAEPSLPPRARQFSHRPDGCLAIAACVRTAWEAGGCIALLDIQNAFNTLSRDAMFETIAPTALYSYARWAYGTPARLFCEGGVCIQSEQGVQQGDPLAPTLFNLTLAESILTWQSSHSIADDATGDEGTVCDLWFADDGSILAPDPATLAAAVSAIEPVLQSVGLALNKDKCEWWCRKDSSPPPGFPPVSKPTLVSLGFPIAGDIEGYVRHKVDKAIKAMEPLANLGHAQAETAILRACGPWSRLSHLLRWIPLEDEFEALMTLADDCARTHLGRILVRTLNDSHWASATRPIALGGFGLGRLASHALADALLCNANVSAIAALAGPPNHFIDSIVDTLRSKPALPPAVPDVVNSADRNDADRLAAQCSDQAGAWILGSVKGPTLFSDVQWRIAVALWIGMDAPAGHADCEQHEAHPQGLARLGCKKANSARIQRHEALAVQLVQCAAQAGIEVRREARFSQVSKERPGDVLLLLPDGAHFVDVTVTSPANLATHYERPTQPAAAAFDRKIAKYDRQRADAGIEPGMFTPLAVTAYGAWDARSSKFLAKLAFIIAGRTGANPGTVTCEMYRRLSAALWKGNAAMMLWEAPRRPWEDS